MKSASSSAKATQGSNAKAAEKRAATHLSTNRRTNPFRRRPVKAFVVEKYKKKGALVLVNMPEPELQDNDVLIRIHAASVNQLDSKIRDGEFKSILPYRPPFILGHDVAGIVIKTGSKVTQFKAGDAVYSRPRDHRIGTFAEFIAVN